MDIAGIPAAALPLPISSFQSQHNCKPLTVDGFNPRAGRAPPNGRLAIFFFAIDPFSYNR